LDLDGHCAGAIVKYKYPHCTMVGMDYGDDFPWNKIDGETEVIMVDFSLQPFALMMQLDELCGRLVWIDHHESAISEAERWAKEHDWIPIAGYRTNKLAACELAWSWFFPDEETMPRAIKLLGRYDVWDLEHSVSVLPFQWGMRIQETTPDQEMDLWERLFTGHEELVDMIIKEGQTCLAYQRKVNDNYCRLNAFDVMFEGIPCVAINAGKPVVNSQLFESVYDPKRHSAMIGFCRRNGRWEVSLYTTHPDIDLSVIALSYGGGGHRKAARFQCDTLPFLVGEPGQEED